MSFWPRREIITRHLSKIAARDVDQYGEPPRMVLRIGRRTGVKKETAGSREDETSAGCPAVSLQGRSQAKASGP